MRFLFNYFRQAFCKHDWLVDEKIAEITSDFGDEKKGIKVYMRCKKCGYHTSHWKFL
jgi:hypothetical protein